MSESPAETDTASAMSATSASTNTADGDNGPLLQFNELHDILMENGESDGDDGSYDDDVNSTSMDVDNTSSSSSSDDSTLEYDFVEEIVPPERPVFPEPHKMPVEQLEMKIRIHKESRTLIDYLTTVDTDTLDNAVQHMKFVTYSRSLQFVEGSSKQFLEGEYEVTGMSYGTPLHHACRDPDGKRGEEKIRMMLNAAKSVGADIRELLLVREGKCDKNQDGDYVLNKDVDASTTPLFLLLENENSTIGSFELICLSWPYIVFLTCKNGVDPARETILHYLLFDAGDKEDEIIEARHVELVRLFLRTAEKGYGGASGLVSATSNNLIGVDKFNISQLNRDAADTLDCDPTTALHLVCTDIYGSAQSSILQMLMRSWPDALLHCVEIKDNFGSFPFHDAAHTRGIVYDGEKGVCPKSNPNQYALRNLCIFLQHSSISGLARALVNVDTPRGQAGFIIARDTLEFQGDEAASKEEKEKAMLLLQMRTSKCDISGKSLFHHVASSDISLDVCSVAVFEEKRKIYYSRGAREGWPLNKDRHADDEAEVEKSVRRLERRNQKVINEAFEWLASINPESATAFDDDGNAPFHHAIACGKTWDRGIESLLEYQPKWVSARNRSGLYPFMIAAMPDSDQDLTTIYNILRSAPQVVAPSPQE